MRRLNIYFTSDTHGYLNPVDYSTGEKKVTGLIDCMGQFHKDGNTLILDGGDTIQGSPFLTYLSQGPDASLVGRLMNLGQYDYVTLGNHDFNYGPEYLETYLDALEAKCLCANVTDRTGKLPLIPYEIRTMENGLRVGIIGVCTDFVNIWEKPENLEHVKVNPVREILDQIAGEVRSQCDLMVGLYHGGIECDLDSEEILSDSRENIAYEICRDFEFDLLCTGHQHMPVASRTYHGTHIVQTPQNAEGYCHITIEETEKTDMEVVNKFHVEQDKISGNQRFKITSELCQPVDEPLQSAVELLADKEHEVQSWLDMPKGHFEQSMMPDTKINMARHGTPIADFFNAVQLKYSGADISCTSLANDIKGFGQDVTIRDIVSTYRYLNTLVVLEVTGEILRAALERCGEYFQVEADGSVRVSDEFLKPKVEHYNFDFFAGIDYKFDVTRPVRDRVVLLQYKGKDVQPQDKFTLCMNNYRASGTGGYEMFRGCPVVREILTDMVELTTNYLEGR